MATFNNGESGLSVRTKINNVLQHTDGTASELVINDAGADVNFRVESDGNASMLFVDAGNNRVGIGVSSPVEILHVQKPADGAATRVALFENNSLLAGSEAQIMLVAGGNTSRGVSISSYNEGATGQPASMIFSTSAIYSTPTERMRITSTGNVGIGTSAPSANLHVLSNGSTISLDTGTVAAFQRNVSTGSGCLVSIVSGSSGNSVLRFGDADNQADGYIQYSNGSQSLQFAAAAAEAMRITAAGNVGIGTTAPLRPLHVASAGSTYITSHNTTSGTPAAILIGAEISSAAIYAWTGPTTGVGVPLKFYTGPLEVMRIDTSGNVGIGTTTPTNLLDVDDDSIRVRTAQTPATAGAAGNQGEIAWDADYIYVCVATNTWKRVAIATW